MLTRNKFLDINDDIDPKNPDQRGKKVNNDKYNDLLQEANQTVGPDIKYNDQINEEKLEIMRIEAVKKAIVKRK